MTAAPLPTIEAQPEVSCVIVAFHRADALRKLLSGLAGTPLDVVVVNVDGDPHVATVAAAAAARSVDLLDNPGYAAAVNCGVRAARSDVVVFMNDDVWIAGTDVLRLAASVGDGHADVAVPKVIDASGAIEIDRGSADAALARP